jgi:hypothetical protein
MGDQMSSTPGAVKRCTRISGPGKIGVEENTERSYSDKSIDSLIF